MRSMSPRSFAQRPYDCRPRETDEKPQLMKSLFLIGTPFHAFLAKRIIIAEQLDADAWVMSYPPTPKSEHYFAELKIVANAVYDDRRPGKLFGPWYGMTRRYFRQPYDRVYCALTQPWYFRRPLTLAKEILTFDDGLGNYVEGSFDDFERLQDRLFARLFSLPTHSEIQGRVVAHYAVRPDLPNSGGRPEMIIPIELGVELGDGKSPVTLAVGHPFEELYDPRIVARVRERLKGLPYFPHPREFSPPPGAISTPDIIEDYVTKLSQEHEVTLVGGFSTALVTIPNVKKIYLDVYGDPKRRAIMESAGCEVESMT